ncbi:DNA mismatch repair protein MutL [Vibrio aerogenes CECT 7868]|uniref:DNA mismatch repair protein MutL n=1 Tax=Vibrio aerogenes CECT 7868 TaxID=1216006 RepID=A0A1M6E8A2_9VIBR|nr:DNA mismatch repair endonuclease MutL [Vibrio aerogenes]SHI81727.1 DNA mismatch repair protein MutL [Vibrio aerogenes CECT 7868]
MTIKILPARLANQIAAGEVVERPASVVKELVENSLDSGATRIDVDIEKGGSKLIRVRDNGHGIPENELTLALSRHATSKIHTLDDLEAIVSLGFRGEALASISSVSRLTLTSRPENQEQAWMAHSEGRDMAVRLQPAAHPAGTTVEVLDLFFNTPARRKFLRTEKTEFTHIDDVLKRIALSRFDVTICVRHNGKIIRQYRAANTDIQQEKRLAAVCGQTFVRHMLKVGLEHQGFSLFGWITTPEGARQQSDLQYCYVNGRMMKDKLINHAIRQSYEATLAPEQFAAYVLYICLDPHQVDVNVHPAKHEVRFHQSRLIHDFIYQALTSALAEGQYLHAPEVNQAAFSRKGSEQLHQREPHQEEPGEQNQGLSAQVLDAVRRTPEYPGRAESHRSAPPSVRESQPSGQWTRGPGQRSPAHRKTPVYEQKKMNVKAGEARVYQQLMKTEEYPLADVSHHLQDDAPKVQTKDIVKLGKALTVIEGKYLLVNAEPSCCLIALNRACLLKIRKQLDVRQSTLKGQPLLVPLSVPVSMECIEAAGKYQQELAQLGIELKPKHKSTDSLMVMTVPQPLRQQNLQKLIPDLLSCAAVSDEKQEFLAYMTTWLADYIASGKPKHYTLSEAIQLIAELEQLFQGNLPLNDSHFIQLADFSATIRTLDS